MLDAWGDHPVVQQAVQEASDALNEDLWRLIHEGPKEALAMTTNTQPVMLLAGVAAWRMWCADGGPVPTVLAGHSLGEFAALVAAGVFTLGQATALVRLRAAAMQAAVPAGTGAMAAILGLQSTAVVAGCAQAQAGFDTASGEVVEAANFNDPGQTVIAGSKAAVDKACEVLKAQGAKRALLLPVSAPFHSSLMKPAADQLKLHLANVPMNAPQIPVLNNVDVAVETDPDRIRDALYRQAFGPVRWVECLRAIKALGVSVVVECGPGKVLAGMTKRTEPELASGVLFDPTTLSETRSLLA